MNHIQNDSIKCVYVIGKTMKKTIEVSPVDTSNSETQLIQSVLTLTMSLVTCPQVK